jgi:hypothetical protein
MKITSRICAIACCVLLGLSLLSPTVSKGNSSLTDDGSTGAFGNGSQDNSPIYIVGRNVRVSVPQPNLTPYEIAGCVNPDDPNLMLIGSMYFTEDGNAATNLYRSTDRGVSWSLVLIPRDIVSDGDPTCIFGPNNTAYYASYSKLSDGHRYTFLYRSSDNGKTWSRSEPQRGIDRPFLAIDRTGGPNNGTIYCSGKGLVTSLDSKEQGGLTAISEFTSTAAVMISRDGGRSLEGPYERAAFGSEYVSAPGKCVVLSDGTLVFPIDVVKDRLEKSRIGFIAPSRLDSIRITGGGKRLEPATTIADWSRFWQNGTTVPMMAVDPGSSSFKDRIYVVRIDEQSGRGRVLLNYSSDQGRTWSRSRVVDDDVGPSDVQGTPNATNSSIAVNRNGVVAVGWADRRDSSDNLGWWYRMSLSFDGGETFLPSFKVASAGHSIESRDMPLFAYSTPVKANEPQKVRIEIHPWYYGGGHTVDMLADSEGVFYPAWVDNRTGAPQVWIAPVTVRGVAIKGGSDELARLTDVTSDVSLEFLTERYDNAKNTIHVTIRLKNKSSKLIYAPAKLRVISLTSELGSIEAVHPAVYQRSGGVVWDLSELLKNGMLGAGEVSDSTELVVRLTHAKRPGQDSGYKFELCNLEARILASQKSDSIKATQTVRKFK